MSNPNVEIISDAFSHIVNKVKLENHLNLQNINIYLEDFFRDILNVIFSDRTFINLNQLDGNFAAIDLGDDLKEIAFQITSTKTVQKIKNTAEKFNTDSGYKKIIVLIISLKKPKRKNDINDNIQESFIIEEWDLMDLFKKISNLTNDKINLITQIVIDQITSNIYNQYSKNTDTSASDEYSELELQDFRNFSEKLLEVCPNTSEIRIKKFARDIASGQAELNKHSDRQISSLKYRVFEACQEELINFCENNSNKELDIQEIIRLIEEFTDISYSAIEERSKDYKYPLNNKESFKKIILTLINDCYLSFDEKGIYT